ncbi:MAG: hypothetical protein J5614_04735, partial [Paludibacteraceae bacterium]|nr:hypothetical protein [Paludibacteraceae bacterium]
PKINKTAAKVLEYTVSLTEQKKVNRSPSKTIPNVIFWLVYFLACIALKIIFKKSINDLQYMTIIAGGVCFAYMGIEYVDSFIKNKTLPKGNGMVKNIDRYRALVYTWCIISVILNACYYIFDVADLPHNEVMAIAGILSIEFVSGNKANAVAVSTGPQDKGETN